MSNTLNIPEASLSGIANRTLTANTIGATGTGKRRSPFQPMTMRITDHPDDEGGTSNPDKMALFTSSAYGQPWIKNGKMAGEHVTFHPVDPSISPVTISSSVAWTQIFVNYDYSDFN